MDINMDLNKNEVSSTVRDFFENKVIFITGATGFVGRFLIYKILKDVNVAKIYICLRGKKNRSFEQRFQEFKNIELFSYLPKHGLLDKLVAVEGDVCQENLGLKPDDLSKILSEVNICYHSAATIRFTEPLKTASSIHILGTQHVVEMCQQMHQFQTLVHVSTATAWSINQQQNEAVPEAPYDPLSFARKIEVLSKREIDEIEKSLIGLASEGKWLNTYALTKSLAENIVANSRLNKVVILRPPFLTSPIKEPMTGWFDEPQSGAGLTALFSLGIIRIGELKHELPVEAVPVDMCVNSLLTTTYYHHEKNEGKKLLVANISISSSNPESSITVRELLQEGLSLGHRFPSVKQIRPPIDLYQIFPSKQFIRLHDFVSHTLFSLMIDLILFISGRKPMLYSLTRKNVKAVMSIFSSVVNYKAEWNLVGTGILQDIYSDKGLTPEDRDIFFFDPKEIPWRSLALENHMRFRRQILKEPDSNLEYARTRLKVITVGYRLFKVLVWTSFAVVVSWGLVSLQSTPLLWLIWTAISGYICGVYILQ
jgi:fatty acyl-CoA reductase